MRFLKSILRKRLFAQDDESRSMWSNIKCGFLAIRALATETTVTEVTKPLLLRRANKNFWISWSKLANKSGRPLGKTFTFGAMGHFSTWYKTLLWYFHSLVGSLIQIFFCSSGAIDGSLLSNLESFLNWPFLVRLSFLTFWVRNSWNSNFEIEDTQTWFILQILRWYYRRKFHVLNFMKNCSNPKIFFEFQKRK